MSVCFVRVNELVALGLLFKSEDVLMSLYLFAVCKFGELVIVLY